MVGACSLLLMHLNILFHWTDVSIEELELLPLFSRMVTQAGTSNLDSVSLSRKIGIETGGVGASYHSNIR